MVTTTTTTLFSHMNIGLDVFSLIEHLSPSVSSIVDRAGKEESVKEKSLLSFGGTHLHGGETNCDNPTSRPTTLSPPPCPSSAALANVVQYEQY